MILAVDNSLLQDVIDIFIKKKAVKYSDKIKNLFNYIQPPIAIGSFQFEDKRGLAQSQGLVRFIDAQNEQDLAKKTKLKFLLSKNKHNYPYINIFNDEFEVNFTATYPQNSHKQKVLDHIKELIQDGDNIEIYDRYLLNDNGDRTNTDDNHKSVNIMNKIISSLSNNQLIVIYCKDSGNNSNETNRINQRKSSIIYHNLNYRHFNLSKHDRYIKIYKNNQIKYEIILSSGLYNILSSKDFTYVVRIF